MPTPTTLDVEGVDIAAALTAWAAENPAEAAALVTALGGALRAVGGSPVLDSDGNPVFDSDGNPIVKSDAAPA